MNKPLSYEQEKSVAGDPGAARVIGGTEVGGGTKRVEQAGAAMPDQRLVRALVKPKGTSITLWGCGRKDGSDINNSMGLVEAYRDVVLR